MLSIIFSGVVALSTVVYAILTWRLTSETRAMRKAQTEPHVSFAVHPSEASVGLMELVVENDGPGPALNVRFEAAEDLMLGPHREVPLSQMGLFRRGVSYMSPGQRYRFFFASTFDNPELITMEPVRVEVTYETALGEKRAGGAFIDFRALEGMYGPAIPDSKKIAKLLEALSADLQSIASGVRHLHAKEAQ